MESPTPNPRKWRVYTLPASRGIWFIAKPTADGRLTTVASTSSHRAAMAFADLCARGVPHTRAHSVAEAIERGDPLAKMHASTALLWALQTAAPGRE
ncbi:hypothetical protein [Corynebacterium bouchesdurhonense]|uniref:hypothetical protein n=1 Tax=Corynebacterium bouchesdurhonense TaxID=1720192 RepID=UPI0011777F58|nr:hypothetical protein [Corynebacterium bouchesdurhonense]